LNASGKLGFTAHGCDVDVSGTIVGHATGNTADGLPVTTPESLGEVVEVRSDTQTLDLGSRYFTDMASTDGSAEDIVVTLTVTNKSKFDITAEMIGTTVAENTAISVTATPESQIIAQNESATVTITLTLTSTASNITMPDTNNLTIAMEFSKYVAPEILTWSDGLGWHIEMGSYNGTTLKWIPIAESADGTTFTYFNGKEYETSKEECKPEAGKNYYFLSLNSLPAKYGSTEVESIVWNYYDETTTNGAQYKAWYYDESSKSVKYYTDTAGNKVDANNYAVSNMRKYLNGETAYTGSLQGQPLKLTPFETLFNLTDDEIWNSKYIKARSIEDLLAKNATDSYFSVQDSEYADMVVPNIDGITGSSDKLWLVSHQEYFEFIHSHGFQYGNYTSLKYGVPLGATEASYWYFRSGTISPVNQAWAHIAEVDLDKVVCGSGYDIRPAFQVTIPA
ncbi:MAG: hypothetical protein IJ318_02795, partial [Clostridia bacterium]|nr:hypothetical protein [Clostridia bacterium]